MTLHPLPRQRFWSRLVSLRTMTVSFAVLLLVLLSGGTAYAAAGAAPGQFLFPVRIHVVEPMVVALTFSEEDKADVELAQAEDRIIEQEQLRVAGDVETAAIHERLLDQKFTELKNRIAKLEARGNSDKALE